MAGESRNSSPVWGFRGRAPTRRERRASCSCKWRRSGSRLWGLGWLALLSQRGDGKSWEEEPQEGGCGGDDAKRGSHHHSGDPFDDTGFGGADFGDELGAEFLLRSFYLTLQPLSGGVQFDAQLFYRSVCIAVFVSPRSSCISALVAACSYAPSMELTRSSSMVMIFVPPAHASW